MCGYVETVLQRLTGVCVCVCMCVCVRHRYVGQLVSAAQEGGLSAAYIEWLRQLESVDAESRDAVHYLSAPTGETSA